MTPKYRDEKSIYAFKISNRSNVSTKHLKGMILSFQNNISNQQRITERSSNIRNCGYRVDLGLCLLNAARVATFLANAAQSHSIAAFL